jgi:mono/diheme cytochrome c family protein
MKRPARIAALAALFSASLGSAALAAVTPDYEQVKAGRYQAILGDCMGCHTRPGGKLFAGGAALQTPFGKMTAPNITPDNDTGIGGWSEAQFRRAVKQGVAPDGQLLYPAMPYPNYARMSDEDVSRIWDYLQTIEPVRASVQTNQLAWPFNIRSLMIGWDWLYFKPGSIKPDAGKSAEWNRGAYIVGGPGHCDTCHSPKSLLGANSGAPLSGASLQGWFAPDITKDAKHGVGSWSVADVAAYLKTGHNAHSMASGPMAEAIEDSTSLMNDADLQAIAVYLKDAPAPSGTLESSVDKNDGRMKAGAAIYRDNCQACHGANGQGESIIFPPFTGNPIISQNSSDTLVRVVLAGTQSADTPGAPTQSAMPSFAWRLNDTQIADVLTYIRGSWGGAGPVSTGTVGQMRSMLQH